VFYNVSEISYGEVEGSLIESGNVTELLLLILSEMLFNSPESVVLRWGYEGTPGGT